MILLLFSIAFSCTLAWIKAICYPSYNTYEDNNLTQKEIMNIYGHEDSALCLEINNGEWVEATALLSHSIFDIRYNERLCTNYKKDYE